MKPRKKNERGLFGLPKKKSILFTFGARQGEECPSDSDDSDYFPGRQSTDDEDSDVASEKSQLKASKKRIKRAVSSDPRRVSKRHCSESEKENEKRISWKGQPLRLPPELLLKIFSFVVESEGITKCLPRLSRVCKAWHGVTSDPFLLRQLDLSSAGDGAGASCSSNSEFFFTKQRFDKLLSSRDLSQCNSFSLAGQGKLAASVILTALTDMPLLTSLDLRKCCVSVEMLKKLPEVCPSLERVDLSHSSSGKGILAFPLFQSFVNTLGPTLVELRLGSMIEMEIHSGRLLQAVMSSCPRLEELDLSMPPQYSQTLTNPQKLDMGALARACPRLVELRLNGFHIIDDSAETKPFNPGFPRLKIYSQGSHLLLHGSKPSFYRIFSDQHLTELDISKSMLKLSQLAPSQIHSIKKLCISSMRWGWPDEETEYNECLQRWGHSIQVLDLSGNKVPDLDRKLSAFTDRNFCARTSLQILDLSNTTVGEDLVVSILKHCKNLKSIDLSCCRELPRGCKRLFSSTEFKQLLKTLLA